MPVAGTGDAVAQLAMKRPGNLERGEGSHNERGGVSGDAFFCHSNHTFMHSKSFQTGKSHSWASWVAYAFDDAAVDGARVARGDGPLAARAVPRGGHGTARLNVGLNSCGLKGWLAFG